MAGIILQESSFQGEKYMGNKCNHVIGAPYSNVIIISNGGNLLATISDRKANWYLKKGLAIETLPPIGYPRAIKLKFEADVNRTPKPFEINVNENKCVICGKENKLTRHHVIPWVIRKHFPLQHKQYARQWCVLLCVECHENVELFTQPLYKEKFPQGTEIKRNTNIALQMIKHNGHLDKLSTEKFANLLEHSTYKSVEEIPPYKNKNKNEFRKTLSIQHKLEIKKWALKFIHEHDDIKGTKTYFRELFLTMNPKYLPEGYLDIEQKTS